MDLVDAWYFARRPAPRNLPEKWHSAVRADQARPSSTKLDQARPSAEATPSVVHRRTPEDLERIPWDPAHTRGKMARIPGDLGRIPVDQAPPPTDLTRARGRDAPNP